LGGTKYCNTINDYLIDITKYASVREQARGRTTQIRHTTHIHNHKPQPRTHTQPPHATYATFNLPLPSTLYSLGSLRNMKIDDLLDLLPRTVETVKETDLTAEAYNLMGRAHVSGVAVVDGEGRCSSPQKKSSSVSVSTLCIPYSTYTST